MDFAWRSSLNRVVMFSPDILQAADSLLAICRVRDLRIVTAESCTGGLIAAALTAVPGASDAFECGLVTYSNDAKTELLGIAPELIVTHGAVSEAIAIAMAEGAVAIVRSGLAIAVTGIAGPGGGSAAKPVGLVHIACVRSNEPASHREYRFGDIGRDAVREATVRAALILALSAVS